MADLTEFALDAGPDVYYSDSFLTVIEDHMTYLREHPKTTSKLVTPLQAKRYAFDLCGLMNELNIPPYFHYTVMRMNKLHSYTDVSENLNSLLVPDEGVMSQIASIHNASTTLTS